MRLKNIPGAREKISESEFVVQAPGERKGTWKEGYDQLWIELGMGKGKFLYEMAERHPEIFFVGIEMYSSVLYKAVLRMEKRSVENLIFVREDAGNLEEFFEPEEVDRIFLNFSDPWPKDRHAKRRLTSSRFLKIYRKVLKDGGEIHFKTDNQNLFSFSIQEIESDPDWKLTFETWDLHGEKELLEENVMTEYEERFSKKGQKICKLIATRV